MTKLLFLLFLLFLATVACDRPGIPTETADAGPSTDATVHGSVELHLGAAHAGKIVFSSKADGSFLFSATTDPNGDARVLTELGGMVSVIALEETLTSFAGLGLDAEINWQDSAVKEKKAIQINFEPYPDAQLYTFIACEDFNYGYEDFTTLPLWVTNDCLQNPVVPIMGFAESFTEGLVAYTIAEVASEGIVGSTVQVDWKTDFAESPIAFVFPDAMAELRVGGVYNYGSLRVAVPGNWVPTTNLHFRRPAGVTELVWTNITSYSPASTGWQVHHGSLPTNRDQWITPVTNLALTHTETELSASWDATVQGDFVTGVYSWNTPTRADSWRFFTTHDEAQIAFPDLPPEVPALPSLTGPALNPLLFVSTVDYGDTETLQEALRDGSFTREFLHQETEAYLATGGRIARGETSVDELP